MISGPFPFADGKVTGALWLSGRRPFGHSPQLGLSPLDAIPHTLGDSTLVEGESRAWKTVTVLKTLRPTWSADAIVAV